MNKLGLSFRSLTVRLAFMLAVIAVVTFSLVGWFLFNALSTELERRDDNDVIAKIRVVRGLLQERFSVEDLQADPDIFMNTAATPDKLTLILKDPSGRVIFSQNAEFELPAVPLVPFGVIPDRESVRSFSIEGVPGRAASAIGAFSGDQKVIIVVARRGFERMKFLHRYKNDILIATILGAVVVSMLGFALIRQGLLPIRRIAFQAGSITAKSLNVKLDTRDSPKEIEELVESFNLMLGRLNDSFQRLSQFSADLAHDLRTPINNLLVQTQVALGQARTVDEYQAVLISNIEEYERLKRMSESMLFLARADNGQIAVEKKLLDCETELTRVEEYFEGVAEDKGINIVVASIGQVYANSLLLSRALGNIVANAIRYTKPGNTIYISSSNYGTSTAISVRNPGPGIAPDHLPRIFDRFYRADAARSDSSSSAGLGLSIVKSIMVLHEGEVFVYSVEHEWTEFVLVFPAPATIA